jgi:hypothetical protein
VASCAISCNDDAGIMLLRTATGKSERGLFYSLNAARNRPPTSEARRVANSAALGRSGSRAG